jgi:DNA repair photolyase
MWWRHFSGFGVLLLSGLWLGEVWVRGKYSNTIPLVRPNERRHTLVGAVEPGRSGAGEPPILDQRIRGTKFIDLGVKSVVNSPESTGMGFWSVNPYVGCEFGCTYCYARYAHRYVVERAHGADRISAEEISRFKDSNNWEIFEHHIFVKQRPAVLAALERDLARIHSRISTGTTCPIVIGTATDPYQPAERRFRITHSILERLLTTRGFSISIITKSSLICRDIELLRKLQRRHQIVVYISLLSVDVGVIKLFESRSPMPHVRLSALRKLSDAGIIVGINAAPVLPGITDSSFRINSLMAAAMRAGAAFVHPSVLRNYPTVRDGYFPIVQEHFPELIPRYRAAYQKNWDAPTDYVTAVIRRFTRAAQKYGISTEDPLQIRGQQPAEPDTQLSLL